MRVHDEPEPLGSFEDAGLFAAAKACKITVSAFGVIRIKRTKGCGDDPSGEVVQEFHSFQPAMRSRQRVIERLQRLATAKALSMIPSQERKLRLLLEIHRKCLGHWRALNLVTECVRESFEEAATSHTAIVDVLAVAGDPVSSFDDLPQRDKRLGYVSEGIDALFREIRNFRRITGNAWSLLSRAEAHLVAYERWLNDPGEEPAQYTLTY